MFLRHRVRWPSVDIQVKFYEDRPRGTPLSGELNKRGVAEYSDFRPIDSYISETVQDRRYVTINYYTSFRLVPKSVTLNDLERRNSPNRRVTSPTSVAFRADYVKLVEYTPVLTAAEM